jgi:hypothetical protein
MARHQSLFERTDWSDLPKIIAASLAVGLACSLVLTLLV